MYSPCPIVSAGATEPASERGSKTESEKDKKKKNKEIMENWEAEPFGWLKWCPVDNMHAPHVAHSHAPCLHVCLSVLSHASHVFYLSYLRMFVVHLGCILRI